MTVDPFDEVVLARMEQPLEATLQPRPVVGVLKALHPEVLVFHP